MLGGGLETSFVYALGIQIGVSESSVGGNLVGL